MKPVPWTKLVAHGIVSVTAGLIVSIAGGPPWAAVMTVLIVWFE